RWTVAARIPARGACVRPARRSGGSRSDGAHAVRPRCALHHRPGDPREWRRIHAVTISPVMQRLAVYIAQAPRKRLPAAVAEKTKHHILDTIAAMVSGARLPPGRQAISYARTGGDTKEGCVVTTGIVTSAETAALANGMLAHADETDDSHAPSLTHPGCGIVPAALAMAER